MREGREEGEGGREGEEEKRKVRQDRGLQYVIRESSVSTHLSTNVTGYFYSNEGHRGEQIHRAFYQNIPKHRQIITAVITEETELR